MPTTFKENAQILWFQLLKYAYYLLSLVFCDSELKIFELWTKQEILFWETLINIFTVFWHFIDQPTDQLFKRLIKRFINNRINITIIGTFPTETLRSTNVMLYHKKQIISISTIPMNCCHYPASLLVCVMDRNCKLFRLLSCLRHADIHEPIITFYDS